ncbi:molybdopterin-guanine dinucleotide biosynthesis protein B [bacterium]|nr:MAG: molybdopterin-guanine dinucleotide biosynthesis protein B [bacterium]
MAPIVSITGLSGSGKTTLLEKVVTELTKRGYTVATLKHDAHGFDIDREGKDSWRHAKAGAVSVALSSPEKFVVIKNVKKEWPPERIIHSYLTGADVVITEGYKKSAFPKIEVVRKAVSSKPVCAGDEKLLAIMSDTKIKSKAPVYNINAFKKAADIIEKQIIKKHIDAKLTLIADGQVISLKPFIEALLREGVRGMIQSLKGCEGIEEIEIRIKR